LGGKEAVNDIVGIRVLNSKGRWIGFLTYGRVFDSTDESELRAAVEAALPGFGVDSAVEVHVCNSLQELHSCPYFYEGLLSFAWDPIPFGDRYEVA
jgi:hypothetical protein